MQAKSIKAKSTKALKDAFNEVIRGEFKPTPAIVLASVKQDRKAVSEILTNAGIKIFGLTTNGEFIDERLGNESAAALLLDIDPSFFIVLFAAYPEKNYREIATELANKAKQTFANPAFLIGGNNMEKNAAQVLFGIEDVVGKQVNVFRGMAGTTSLKNILYLPITMKATAVW